MIQLEKEEKAENLSHIWMGSNLQYKGLQEVLKKINVSTAKPKELSVREVNKDWKRLASFMGKQR